MHLSSQILSPAKMAQSSPILPPTAQESFQLAALVPLSAAQAVPESVFQVVSTVFEMCRHQWVADFLFSKEMTPLSALTAPVNLNHAISCTVTMTSVERLVGLPRCAHAPPNPFDMHLHGDYVFVPAFSVGPISVGFGIQNCAVSCQADWGLSHRRDSSLSHFRYVRDDERGILVNIRDDQQSDVYKVEYIAHQSATRRRRMFLTIERAAVQRILSGRPNGIDPQALVPAIRIVQTSDEFRNCPYCGTPKTAACDCEVQLQVPKHPLDFDSMFINMSSYLGSFEGVTASRFCFAGMERLSARLGSRITIGCKMDSDLLDKLSTWAIEDQLKNVREDPMRCIMPAADQEMTDSGFRASRSGETTEIDLDIGGNFIEDEMDAVLEMDALPDEMTQPTKDIDFSVSTEGLDNVLGLNKDGLQTVNTQEMFERLSPSSTDGDDEVQLANEIAREAQLAYQAENEVREHSVPSGTSTTDVQTLDTFDLEQDVTESEEARLHQEKERKAELRRQRNREAAQRSNKKRKEKNDSLKAELRASHDKAAELRAKELVLREENIRLRKLLSSQ